MKCELCGREFPHRTGRFCGSCFPEDAMQFKAYEYKYFFVNNNGLIGKRKTATYSIHNNKTGIKLGEIRWYAPWRQFCLFPARFTEVVWSRDCLDDIQDCIDKATAMYEHRTI